MPGTIQNIEAKARNKTKISVLIPKGKNSHERINGVKFVVCQMKESTRRKMSSNGRAAPRVRGQNMALDMMTWVSLIKKLTLERRSERGGEKKVDEHLGRATQKQKWKWKGPK